MIQTTNEELQKPEREEAFSHINKRAFFVVVSLLLAVMMFSGFLTYIVPQGAYLRDETGMLVDGTYTQGATKGMLLWKILSAPVRVFASSDALTIIMISAFLLIMSGVFNLLDKTGGMRVIIGKTVHAFSHKKKTVVCIITLIFMAFGSFFGMFEELVTLLPLIIVLMLSMGFDSLTGLGVCMMAACFGFSSAITNPFSVGLVADLAGTHVFDGAWLRVVFFVIVYTAVCTFLLFHIKTITKSPTRSLTYENDQKKLLSLDLSVRETNKDDERLFKIFVSFFSVQLIVLFLIASIRSISGLAIPILAVSFLLGGVVTGLCVCDKKTDPFKHMANGALAMLPAVLMIALASSVKLIMEESGILDTIMHGVINALQGKNKILCIVLVYFLILFLQIFIGSSSAKIMLIMPIILPIATSLGLSPTIIILTYCIADGFTDVILPTNPVLIIGLSMANVSYGKWVKWTWKFQLLLFIFTILLLTFAVQIGY